MITSLDSIYGEIDEYNNIYWSKFLFWMWLTLETIISTIIYQSIFGEMDSLIIFIMAFASVLCTSFLLMIINTSSSVHLEANKSYKLLNYCIFSYRSRHLTNKRRIKVRIKYLFCSKID